MPGASASLRRAGSLSIRARYSKLLTEAGVRPRRRGCGCPRGRCRWSGASARPLPAREGTTVGGLDAVLPVELAHRDVGFGAPPFFHHLDRRPAVGEAGAEEDAAEAAPDRALFPLRAEPTRAPCGPFTAGAREVPIPVVLRVNSRTCCSRRGRCRRGTRVPGVRPGLAGRTARRRSRGRCPRWRGSPFSRLRSRIHMDACQITYRFMSWNYPLAEVQYWDGCKFPEWDWGRVAEEAGTSVGFIAMTNGLIDQLFVHPDAQRKGVGSALLNLALRRGIRPVRLHVF